MVIKQTEPDVDSWKQQEDRRRGSSRNRKWLALAVAAVIGIVAVVVAIRATDDETRTQPRSRATGTAAIPTEPSIPPLPNGSIEPGRYAFTTYSPNLDPTHLISFDVPRGFQGFEGWAALMVGTSQTAVSTMGVDGVYADPCRSEETLLEISSTDDVVAALTNQEGLRVSTPTDVTVDGFAATYMERRVPARLATSDCDLAQFRVYHDGRGAAAGARFLVAGELQQLWILDIDGAPLVIDASLNPGTSPEVRADLLQIVESIQIDPR